jgi:hypothetical protein
MHTPYRPLPAIIQPAANTLATGQIKPQRKRPGFIKDNFAVVLVGQQRMVAGH